LNSEVRSPRRSSQVNKHTFDNLNSDDDNEGDVVLKLPERVRNKRKDLSVSVAGVPAQDKSTSSGKSPGRTSFLSDTNVSPTATGDEAAQGGPMAAGSNNLSSKSDRKDLAQTPKNPSTQQQTAVTPQVYDPNDFIAFVFVSITLEIIISSCGPCLLSFFGN